MKNILLIRLKAIGDVIFTLPAVAVLREHYPEAKISFLASKENAPLLQGFRDINQVIALDRAALKKGNPLAMSLEFLGLLRRLRAGRFSLVVDFQGFGETAWMSWLTGAPQRWGSVYGRGRRWAYTRGLRRNDRVHPADWDLQLLAECGLTGRTDPERIRAARRCPDGGARFFQGKRPGRRRAHAGHPAVHQFGAKELAAGKFSGRGAPLAGARGAGDLCAAVPATRRAWSRPAPKNSAWPRACRCWSRRDWCNCPR